MRRYSLMPEGDIVVFCKPVALSKIEAREQLCENDNMYNDKAVRYFHCTCWGLCSDKACKFCSIVFWDVIYPIT